MNLFISHAWKDRPLARELAARLTEAGFHVWDPEEQIDPGDNWAKKMGKALEEADFMVILLTPKALDSDLLRQDLQYALFKLKFQGRFFSVLLGPTFSSREVPWILFKLPHLQIESKKELDKAVNAIQKMALVCQ